MNPFQTLPTLFLRIVFLEVMRVSGDASSKKIRCFPDIALDESAPGAEEEELNKTKDDMTGKRKAALIIARVCKNWYAAFVGYPVLWSNLYITHRTTAAAVRTWISRSRTVPLDITLNFTDNVVPRPATSDEQVDSVPTGADGIRNMLDILQQKINRWRGFSITVLSRVEMLVVLEYLSILAMPVRLEDLRLVCVGHVRREVYPYPHTALFGGPVTSLNTLRFQGIPSHIGYPGLMLHLNTLVLRSSTSLVYLPWISLMTVLRGSTGLESLTIWDFKCRVLPVWVNPKSVITLPHVSILSIGRLSMPFAAALLNAIYMPSVQKLTLEFDGSSSTVVFRQLYGRGLNRQPLLNSVKILTVIGVFAPDNVMLSVLMALESLTALNVQNSWALFNVLEQTALSSLQDECSADLSIDPHNPLLCRKLTSITSSGIKGLEMGAYVVARAAMKFRIERVNMRSEDVGEDELALLRCFVMSAESFDDI